jgi:hypothetical protein
MSKVIKWLPRIFLCGLVVWILSGVVGYYLNKPAAPPSVRDAPWVIQTYSNDILRVPSRVYYATDVEIKQDGTPVAKTYWSFNGNNYKKHSGTIEFPVSIYGNISIKRRS